MTSVIPSHPPRRAAEARRDRLVVFSDDWGRHPSSCQHLVRHLLDDCDVSWVNTIGTRPPRMNLATLRRGFEKFHQWQGRKEPAQQPGTSTGVPRVFNPLMWPGFRTPWQRRLNQRLLARFMQRNVSALPESTVLTSIPIVADLVGTVPVRRWVYYCVDDFSSWPGLDSGPLSDLEEKLVAKADCIVAAGDNLADRIRRLGRDSIVISHGIDLDHWTSPATPDPILRELPRPIVLFWGLIDRRLEIAYLAELGRRMTAGTILLLGPEQDPDSALSRVPRVQRRAAIPYERLPAAAAVADVLIMPYADLPVTRAMQPLKLKEYLATGKPVVASRLPAVTPWEQCMDVVENADDFAAVVLRRAVEGTPASQLAARHTLSSEKWRAKAAALRPLLFEDLI